VTTGLIILAIGPTDVITRNLLANSNSSPVSARGHERRSFCRTSACPPTADIWADIAFRR